MVYEKKRGKSPWAEVVRKGFMEKGKIGLRVEGRVKHP